ncbi:putative fungal-specific transcription factor [Mycena galericulata]|nr:putative fungal-specific transcription factor [Mycena galericulata]
MTLNGASDTEPPNGKPKPKAKQRRMHGACDFCRKRKMRCDSAESPDNRCTHCRMAGLDCTHVDHMKTSLSAKGYVAALEKRIEKMERLLRKLLPGVDLTQHLENEDEDDDFEPLFRHVETLQRNDTDELSGSMEKLTLNPAENRFFGRSSALRLVQTAANFQRRFAGAGFLQTPRQVSPGKRKEFWDPPQWLFPVHHDAPQYIFPDPDLLPVLVTLYFEEVNPFFPVLHRPTFDRKVADKLYLVDFRFGATLLMVCCLGARHSDDSRVILEGQTTRHSAGWRWYSQVRVRVTLENLLHKPDLYELQTIALSTLYLLVLSPPTTTAAWNQVGFGLRRAQEVGAHRRKIQPRPTAENEQWKRVFWVLLCLEWIYGTLSGRPVAIHDQDFDQELPLECDDEFWDLPEPHSFKQPKDKPSSIEYFNCYAKVLEIQAAVTTTLYCARKPSSLCGTALPPTNSETIMSFDSALNSWLSQVPEHLRWDPECKDRLRFNQSAVLHAAYYNVQILLHRPFIPAPLETSPPSPLPSLAICTNAARSCARIFEVHSRRGIPIHFNNLPAAFTAGLVLLLNAWCARRPGFPYDPPKELHLVFKCIEVATEAETRYLAAGRLTDLLNRFVQAESVDHFFQDIEKVPSAPSSADGPYGPSASPLTQQRLDSESAAQWASAFTQHRMEEFETASRVNPDTYRAEEGSVPVPVDTYAHPNTVYDFEQFMNMDLPSYSAEMPVDLDAMSMWSTVPATFSVDDWSYIMAEDIAGPQFDQFAPPASQAYLEDPVQDITITQQFIK